MTNLHFPMYSYTVFKPEDLEYDDPESKNDLNRYDFFDLTKSGSYYSSDKFIDDMIKKYKKIEKKGFDYKDFILHRYFFKEFVIRDYFYDNNDRKKIKYYKFSISDWNKNSKKEELDDRVLTANIYSYIVSDIDPLNRDLAFKIKIGHKDDVLKYVDFLLNKYKKNKNNLNKENFYVLPLYFTLDNVINNITVRGKKKKLNLGEYVRISKIVNYYDNELLYKILESIKQSLILFSVFNMYMLDKVEENEYLNFNNSKNNYDHFISYIEEKAKEDKHVIVHIDDYLEFKVSPNHRNIYRYGFTRKLCDYKFQVRSHQHKYWVGSRKNGTRRLITRTVEAYYKNKDKEFRIIKEHVI